ncbi:hypothetical protein POL68_02750 [Stigmatella sp. ncwal1]|uniref:Porin n=1 Tax=Stigmatella ashevillensis TaxID=2995309 RepID=A0ABT5D138_9BACT|nr:hypothetical protein [Stigmatella ashevillena]MDC0707380.1 hypothetical protein [Stigmatella ashevillena]
MGAMRKLLVACMLLAGPSALAARVFDSSLRLTAEGRYDDDFRAGDPGTAPGTGGQFMSKVSPRLGLEMKDPLSTGEAFYAADVLMRYGSGNTTLDHRAGMDLRQTLTRRMRLELSGRFFRVTDPTSLPRQGMPRSRAPILYGQAKVATTGRITRRLDIRAGYAFEGASVEEPGREPGYVHTPSIEAWYRTTRRLSLGLEYRYQGFLYGSDFSDAHGAFAGLRYRLTRLTAVTVRGGPVLYNAGNGTSGVLPRVSVELAREGELFDLGLLAGHDLVGASGFTNTLWADYASLVMARRFSERLSVYGAGSYFRNGRAPGQGVFSLGSSAEVSQGYAVGGGVDYRLSRYLTLQAAVDRIAQVGNGEAADGVDLTRNVAAVRLMITAW